MVGLLFKVVITVAISYRYCHKHVLRQSFSKRRAKASRTFAAQKTGVRERET